MSVDTPTPETQNPQGEPEDLGSLDAAAAAFAARLEPKEEDKPEAQTTEAEPDPEPESEADTEADEADPEADEQTEELVEVEFEGKTFKVPPELQKGLLRQSDYSRKMNEVSEKEKTYTQRLELIEHIEKIADERSEALAQVRLLDEQIKQFESVDWAKAQAENPGEAALAAVRLLNLQNQRKEAANAAAQIARKMTETRHKLDLDKRVEMEKVLDKQMPGWRGEEGVKFTAYAMENGWKPEEIGSITDPRVVLAIDKARRFDALQKSKEQVKAKAKDAPPVVKPGAARPRVDQTQEAMTRLRKTNSVDDAAAAFLARMK